MKRTTKLSKKRKMLLQNKSQEVLRRHEAADSHRIVCAATGGMSERVKRIFTRQVCDCALLVTNLARTLVLFMRKQQRGNEVSYEYYNVKGKDSSRHSCAG